MGSYFVICPEVQVNRSDFREIPALAPDQVTKTLAPSGVTRQNLSRLLVFTSICK